MTTDPVPAMDRVTLQPTSDAERYRVLDLLRGLALFGVLLVNLMGAFRISLFDQILNTRQETGWASELINESIAALVEFKAFALFSFLFGVGAAIQVERAAGRNVSGRRFLARRFTVLFAIGLTHMLLIWNGDILALYAVCGLLLIPFIAAKTKVLAATGAVAIVLPYLVPLPVPWPSTEAMRADAIEATRVYAQGGFAEILIFRCHEAWGFILPLLLSSLPRTLGLMLWGVAAWRSGILCGAEQHRRILRSIWFTAGPVGLASTVLQLLPLGKFVPSVLLELGASIPLALAYAAAVWLWVPEARVASLPGLAAIGQMALTNYVMQSVILSLIFYRYGLGLFGKLTPAQGLAIAIALYFAQIAFSRSWLRRFRFGPLEWLWRSLTYGQCQQVRRKAVRT